MKRVIVAIFAWTMMIAFVTALGSITATFVALSISLVVGAVFVFARCRVAVPELEIWVIYSRHRHAYSRMVQGPSWHWINPFSERVEQVISREVISVRESSRSVRTAGGISLKIEWSITFCLNPLSLAPEMRPLLARRLPSIAAPVTRSNINNLLQHVLGNYTPDQLWQPGVLPRLERQLQVLVIERLAPFGIVPNRLMLQGIEMPAQVQASLHAAIDRQISSQAQSSAWLSLSQILRQLTEVELDRLIELERLRLLGANGATLIYPVGAVTAAPPAPAPPSLSHAAAPVAPQTSTGAPPFRPRRAVLPSGDVRGTANDHT